MEFDGIILLADSIGFNREAPYDIKLMGKAMKEWVALALGENIKYVNYKNSDDVIDVVRPLAGDSEFTVVLFSDTPLIKKSTVMEALAHISDSGQNVVKLVRGYVFRTEFMKTCEKLYAPQTYYCGDDDFLYAPDFTQLGVVADALKTRIMSFHMRNGVHFIDPATTYIDAEVTIGKNVTVYPNNILTGDTKIADSVTLFAGNVINESTIREGAEITSSNINGADIGAKTTVGPYAYIRPKTRIGEKCRIGDFVELKSALIGNRSKVSHLAYVGDAEIGEECNIGCGVVFVNYDGKNKNKTVLGNRVFIGSNSNLIAPLKLEDNAYVAAGSTLTDDVPGRALAIARARQVIKPDWNKDKF